MVKKFPALYWILKFITAYTRFRRLFLSWARSIQSMQSHRASWRFVLILHSFTL